jgi:hypothetical protein
VTGQSDATSTVTDKPSSELKDRVGAAASTDSISETRREPHTQAPPSIPIPHPGGPRAGDRTAVAPLPQLIRSFSSSTVVVLLTALLIGLIWYVFVLRSQVTTETDQRQQVEAALLEETKRLNLLKKQVTEQERQVAALKEEFTQRSGDISRLKDAVVSRDHELVRINKDLVQRDQELVSLRKTFAQRNEMLGVIQSPNVKVIWLSGSHKAQSARAFVLFDPQSKKGVLYAYNLPPPPPGKTYQLWAILEKPVNAGTFIIDSGNKGRLLFRGAQSWSRVSKFAVSLERQGGRPKLPGDIYLGVGL